MSTYILSINREDLSKTTEAKDLFVGVFNAQHVCVFPEVGHTEGIIFNTEEEVSQADQEYLGLRQAPPELQRFLGFRQVA
tara:strand:- start:2642 stop:2881 length:240 start_codon:yes stop_codon:yes gene_type:complete